MRFAAALIFAVISGLTVILVSMSPAPEPVANVSEPAQSESDFMLSDDPRVSPGVCRSFGDDDNVAPHGYKFVQVCAPLHGPENTHLTGVVEEDGFGSYGNDTNPRIWTIDPETGQFFRYDTDEVFQG